MLESLKKMEVSRDSRKIFFKEKKISKKITGKKFSKKAFTAQVAL